jgi:hypothetical protein
VREAPGKSKAVKVPFGDHSVMQSCFHEAGARLEIK